MEIKIENYRLIPNDISITKWDLYEDVIRENKKTKENYNGTKIIGYGMTLQRCIDIISQSKIIAKFDVLTLKEYVNEYRNMVIEIKNLLNIEVNGNKN